MEKNNANGRYLCANESLTMRELVELLKSSCFENSKLPKLNMAGKVGDFIVKVLSYTQPKGTGSYMRTHIGKTMRFDNSKIKKELGLDFLSVKLSVLDAVKDLFKWGHIPETIVKKST